MNTTRLDEMNKEYEYFCSKSIEVNNPHLDEKQPKIEQLVTCRCFGQYRVWVNGNNPIADTTMKDIYCPHCGSPAGEFSSISGHSAGCFNATVGWLEK